MENPKLKESLIEKIEEESLLQIEKNTDKILQDQKLNNNNLTIKISKNESEDLSYNSGRWTEEEHQKFIEGILEYGNEWKKVRKIIKTRTSTQARSHAQKFFLRIKKNISEIQKKKNKNFDENLDKDNNTFFNYVINIFSNGKKNKIELTQAQKEKLISVINCKFSNDNKNELDIDSEEDDENYIENLSINKKRNNKKNHHNKIFDIKKDFKHRNSMELPINSLSKIKIENNINNNVINIENKINNNYNNNNNYNINSNNNININNDNNKIQFTPLNNNTTNIYEEMQNLFSQKKRLKENQRQRYNSTSNEYDIDMDIFGDTNFFPQNNNKNNNINSNFFNSDPFNIDFDKFHIENNNKNNSPFENDNLNQNDDEMKKIPFDFERLSYNNDDDDIQMN